MRKDAKQELLRQVPLFAGCTKRELGEIRRPSRTSWHAAGGDDVDHRR